MKLLILTQKVDKNDDVLGFFHTWLTAFAAHHEQVTVIALGVGEYDLPKNVHVFSLGKEIGASRVQYLLNFYRYIFRERANYDSVFVHMNDIYVRLGGIFWRMTAKTIYLWRNHPKGDWTTHLAVLLAHTTYAVSRYSYVNEKFPERVTLMPAGIDTDLFVNDEKTTRASRSVLFFGRLSPVKHVDRFLEAILELKKSNVSCEVYVVGNPHNPGDKAYTETLHRFVVDNGLSDTVTFLPAIPNHEAPELYRKYDIYVNTTTTGSFDKTILEAMSSGMLVVTSNQSFKGEIPDMFIAKDGDTADLAHTIKEALSLLPDMRNNYQTLLRKYVITHHSLKGLIGRMFR